MSLYLEHHPRPFVHYLLGEILRLLISSSSFSVSLYYATKIWTVRQILSLYLQRVNTMENLSNNIIIWISAIW